MNSFRSILHNFYHWQFNRVFNMNMPSMCKNSLNTKKKPKFLIFFVFLHRSRHETNEFIVSIFVYFFFLFHYISLYDGFSFIADYSRSVFLFYFSHSQFIHIVFSAFHYPEICIIFFFYKKNSILN